MIINTFYVYGIMFYTFICALNAIHTQKRLSSLLNHRGTAVEVLRFNTCSFVFFCKITKSKLLFVMLGLEVPLTAGVGLDVLLLFYNGKQIVLDAMLVFCLSC